MCGESDFCGYAKENFDEYADEKLNSKDMAKIEKHLEICSKCRGFFSEMKKFKKLYPDFEKDFYYPRYLDEKIKNLLENIEKTKV